MLDDSTAVRIGADSKLFIAKLFPQQMRAVRIRRIESRFDFFDRNVNYDGQTGESRPDVHDAYPDAPNDTGFRIPLPFQFARTPTVAYTCAYALDDGTERLLGCKTVG